MSLAVALLATSLTACATTSSGATTEQSNETHHPNDIHKLHHLLPSFLFASAAEQQQKMMKPPPSKSFASRMCGAGSNADKEGECANADAAAGEGKDEDKENEEDDTVSSGEGEDEEEEEESAYVESNVDPETCAKWVTEDATRRLHPNHRPEMLGRCADACRDIAGVTAKDLTEEQMYEDAARGYVYYYHILDEEEEEEGGEEGDAEKEEEEEEEYECIDYEERCKEWIWEHKGCWHNYEYMEEYCPRSCNVCYTKGELNVINFGVPQLTNTTTTRQPTPQSVKTLRRQPSTCSITYWRRNDSRTCGGIATTSIPSAATTPPRDGAPTSWNCDGCKRRAARPFRPA